MLSITIPTKNRPAYLHRQVQYYFDVGFKGNLYIGDSSHAEIAESTEFFIEKFRGRMNIIYRKFPELGEAETTQKLLDIVSTPYAVWSGDDDFLVPKGLDECIEFLESNPEYHAAHGVAIAVNHTNNNEVTGSWKYYGPVVEGDTASKRLLQYLDNGSDVHYSVHRIESRRRMYKYSPLLKSHILAAAEMPCLMSVILGSIKQLDCLTLVRGIHNTRHKEPDVYERILNPEWCNSLHILHESLSDELAQTDNITVEQAKEIVKIVMRKRFMDGVQKGMAQKKMKITIFKYYLKKISIIKKIHYIYSRTSFLKNKEHLTRSLRSTSPYYSDFMPIYSVITNFLHNDKEQK